MPRRGASITQADIARIVRGMKAGGIANVRTVIRPDGIYIEADEGQPTERENRLAQRTRLVVL